jgi:FtsH-binding integral membrane protein
MSWPFFHKEGPPKIAYLALCLAVLAFFAPGMYFVAMDQDLPQDVIGQKGFILGMILSGASLALSIFARYHYRKKDNKEATKFTRTVIIVSSVILIFQIIIFTVFLTT